MSSVVDKVKGLTPAKIMQMTTDHFSNTDFIRTPAQLEREKWLIPKIVPFNRYLLMPAALAIQLCVGSLYAWSGYNLAIERAILGPNVVVRTAVDRSQASITFYIAVAVFGCAAAMLGPWLERNGPFKGTLLGACLFYAGNLLAGLAVYTKQMWLVYIGYGVVGGMGLGIGYISPVSPLQKFFPEMRGVAAGLAVCGFGGGSIIAPIVQNVLIGQNYAGDGIENIGVPLTFVTLGTIYFVVMIIAGLVLRMPPPGYQVKGITVNTIAGAEKLKTVEGPSIKIAVVVDEKGEKVEQVEAAKTDEAATEKDKNEEATVSVEEPTTGPKDVFSLTLPQALLSREFRLMYVMFFGSQITGLLSISKIQNIMTNQLGTKQDVAGYYNSGLSACNLLGRLILPTISDFVGRKPIFVVSLCIQAIFAGLIPTAIHEKSFELVVTSFFIVGFFYGGGFGMIPAFLADQFSSKNVGATHGVILTSWSLTGVAGVLIFNNVLIAENARYQTSTPEGKPNLIYIYDINFRWLLGVVIFCAIICSIIPANLQIRMIPKVPGEIFRFRSYNGRMVRVMKPFKFVVVSKEQEQKEWDDYLAVVNPQ